MTVVLKVVQPAPHQHRSYIAFGPDGYLYIGLGDIPPKQGRASLAQNPKSLFGKILRIDISDPQRYTIPSDNPFAQGTAGAPEVWALGFQQPRYLSFDFSTKRLFVVDSSPKTQEIDLVERGKNYGWDILAGGDCLGTKCDSSALTRPIYSHEGPSVGGFLYSNDLHQQLKGSYIFADTGSRTISKLTNIGGEWKSSVLTHVQAPVVALGQSVGGDVYVATEDGSIAILAP